MFALEDCLLSYSQDQTAYILSRWPNWAGVPLTDNWKLSALIYSAMWPGPQLHWNRIIPSVVNELGTWFHITCILMTLPQHVLGLNPPSPIHLRRDMRNVDLWNQTCSFVTCSSYTWLVLYVLISPVKECLQQSTSHVHIHWQWNGGMVHLWEKATIFPLSLCLLWVNLYVSSCIKGFVATRHQVRCCPTAVTTSQGYS